MGQGGGGRGLLRIRGKVLGGIGRLCLHEGHLLVGRISYPTFIGREEDRFTNKEDKSVRWGSYVVWPCNLKLTHPRHDGTDKIDIKYRVDVDNMKSYGYG